MGQLKSKQLLNNIMKVFIAISALIATALAVGPPAPYHPAPYAAPHHAPAYDDVPAAYNFAYGVADEYSGATSGSYNVALPDGRIQTVTYHVDDAYGGYVADVSYSGEPIYPKYEPKPYKAVPHPAPYHPAPYHPAPAPYHG